MIENKDNKNQQFFALRWSIIAGPVTYLIQTFHKSLKLFDDKMKLLRSVYSHHQLIIDYGFKLRKFGLFWGLTEAQ